MSNDQNEHNKAINKFMMLICLVLGAVVVKGCEQVARWF